MSAKSRYGKKPPRRNYQPKLEALYRAGLLARGTVTMVDVFHDSWCAYFKDRTSCDCRPDIKLTPVAGLQPRLN
jgi:hypothetical protein